jgi:ABC-2 type transport system ATP-binding protein
LLAPTSGSIRILGEDLQANSADIKRQIGVVPEGMALFGRLTADEYLRFVGRMYGLDRTTTLNRTRDLLEFMQLAGEQKKLIADFSHGMQKKLALAAAVIHGPKVLFLDEPFEGVDAVAAGTLKAMLLRMIARGATIFLTSHVLEIVERLCTHIAIIHRGQLVAQGSLDELRAGAGSSGQAEIQEGAALAGAEKSSTEKASLDKRSLEQIFLAIVGTDRDGNPAATASEQELSWLS